MRRNGDHSPNPQVIQGRTCCTTPMRPGVWMPHARLLTTRTGFSGFQDYKVRPNEPPQAWASPKHWYRARIRRSSSAVPRFASRAYYPNSQTWASLVQSPPWSIFRSPSSPPGNGLGRLRIAASWPAVQLSALPQTSRNPRHCISTSDVLQDVALLEIHRHQLTINSDRSSSMAITASSPCHDHVDVLINLFLAQGLERGRVTRGQNRTTLWKETVSARPPPLLHATVPGHFGFQHASRVGRSLSMSCLPFGGKSQM